MHLDHPHPRIAIVGASPGGLQLARLLHLAGMAVSVFERDAGPLARPQSNALRAQLLDALPARCVYWDCELVQVLPWGDGCWKLVLDGGDVGPFDLVVGADGAASRVRPPLLAGQPQHRGLTLLGHAARMAPLPGDAGVNAALLDATELGRLLGNDSDWARAIATYEAAALVRWQQAATGPTFTQPTTQPTAPACTI